MFKRMFRPWTSRGAAVAPGAPQSHRSLIEDELYTRRFSKLGTVDKGVQILLQLKYQELLRSGSPRPSFDDVEFRAFSQNGEDGILLYVFSLIGASNKRCVEMCAGNGLECNTANLIINHRWEAMLVDGNQRNVEIGQSFYRSCPETRSWPPRFIKAWLTAEGVDDLLRGSGMTGPIDLLSVDIDGNDYWLWEGIRCIEPRVVVVEYQTIWGPDHAVTQVYRPDHVWRPGKFPEGLCGASLPAFVKLGKKKGYRLVGVHRNLNAFFLRNGVGDDIFPEIPVDSCFASSFARFQIARRVAYERTQPIEGWVEV